MDAASVIRIFSACFETSHATLLVGGASEPLYEPACHDQFHRIYFRQDYASSALHEVAHWCIAGKTRREQLDYGYWYEEERDLAAQRAFEVAEIRPQGLEWVFSQAAGVPFRLSCDNFDPATLDLPAFRIAVQLATNKWLGEMPARALTFTKALTAITNKQHALHTGTYKEPPQ